jgi:hypothetical protein
MAPIISRVPHRFDADESWIKSIQSAISDYARDDWGAVTSIGLPGMDYATWFAGQARMAQIVVLPFPFSNKCPRSIEWITREYDLDPGRISWLAPLPTAGTGGKQTYMRRRDQLVLEAADELAGIAIRPGGYWESAITTGKSFNNRYQVEYPTLTHRTVGLGCESAESTWIGNNDYLVHFTHGVWGPWPGERLADYFAAITAQKAGNPRNDEETLAYIMNSGILRGSGSMVRGGVPVISFSSLAPHEFLKLSQSSRVSHRTPPSQFGLAIPAQSLKRLGARAVIYGDDELFHSLSEGDKPFFQFKGAGHAGERAPDWSREAEWRLSGDLDLTSLRSEIILLAPNAQTASRIALKTGVSCIPIFTSL